MHLVWFFNASVFGRFNMAFKKMEVARWQHGYVQEAPTTLFQMQVIARWHHGYKKPQTHCPKRHSLLCHTMTIDASLLGATVWTPTNTPSTTQTPAAICCAIFLSYLPAGKQCSVAAAGGEWGNQLIPLHTQRIKVSNPIDTHACISTRPTTTEDSCLLTVWTPTSYSKTQPVHF